MLDHDFQSFVQKLAQGGLKDQDAISWLKSADLSSFTPEDGVLWTDALMKSGQVFPRSDALSLGVLGPSAGKLEAMTGALCASWGLPVRVLQAPEPHGPRIVGSTEPPHQIASVLSTPETQDFVWENLPRVVCPLAQKLDTLLWQAGVHDPLWDLLLKLARRCAESPAKLVLCVPVGRGSGITEERAKALAAIVSAVAGHLDLEARTLLFRMEGNAGYTLGGALEYREVLEVFQDKPSTATGFAVALASEIISFQNPNQNASEALERLRVLLKSKIASQNIKGALELLGASTDRLHQSYHQEILLSPREGYLQAIDAQKLREVVADMNLTYRKQNGHDDPTVGMEFHYKIGDFVELCEDIVTLHFNRESGLRKARNAVMDAFIIKPKEPEVTEATVLDRIDA